jgi:hypothetical protein
MRLGFLVGLVLLACGGESANTTFDPVAGAGGGASGSSISDGGSGSKGGKPSVNKPQGGSQSTAGGATAAGSGGATTAGSGGSAAGNGDAGGTSGAAPSDGGASGAAAGDGGASGAAAGDGGAAGASGSAPNDTGCVERPWTGNQGDLNEKALGLDCSSCSTGAELGYTAPAWCGEAKQCQVELDVAALGFHDVLILLPPGAEQTGICTNSPVCKNDDGDAENLAGYVAQLRLRGVARIDVDESRRVVYGQETLEGLVKCDDVATCAAFGDERRFKIIAKVGAPRGWARIRLGGGACP